MVLEPWAEHKAHPIHDSKEKLEAQHWKTAKLLELPPSPMEAANPGTREVGRWGGAGAKRPRNQVTSRHVLPLCSCPEPCCPGRAAGTRRKGSSQQRGPGGRGIQLSAGVLSQPGIPSRRRDQILFPVSFESNSFASKPISIENLA